MRLGWARWLPRSGSGGGTGPLRVYSDFALNPLLSARSDARDFRLASPGGRRQTAMSRVCVRVSVTTTGDPQMGRPLDESVTYGGSASAAARYISAGCAV